MFVLTVMAALAEGFGIALLLPLLQATEVGQEELDGGIQQVMYDLLQWMGIADSIVWILAFIGAVFVAKGLLKFAEQGYFGYLQAQLLRELKSKLYDAYNTMDYRYYISRNTGHFINVMNGQINGFYSAFMGFIGFLSQVITVTTYFAVAFLIAWEFALMAVGIGFVILYLFKYLNEYVRGLSRKAAKEKSTLNSLLVQALQGFKYIAATGQKGHLREGVIQSIWRYTGYELRKKLASAVTSALKEPISVFFLIGVIIIQVTVFNAAIAPIFVALILFHRGMQGLMGIQASWQGTMDKVGSLEMVDDEFAALRHHKEIDGTRTIGPLSEAI
ncbi:MAG: ABC transporter ATP-binding protein, partial [Spiribacter salinus]